MRNLAHCNLCRNAIGRKGLLVIELLFDHPKVKVHQQKYSSTTTGSRENPYSVLNVPSNSSHETVKAAFIKAALKHHPDHSKSPDSTAEFIRIRQAFEKITSIQENNSNTFSDGNAMNHSVWESDADFYDWFKKATSEYFAFEMDSKTRNEVIDTYRTMSSGGLDRGGHWEMARQLAERHDAFLRAGGCTTGDIDEDNPSPESKQPLSTIRRTRKR